MQKRTAIAVAITSLFALILWDFGMNATDAAGARPEPEYAVATDPYLPFQNLEPVYDLRPLIHDVIPAWRLEKRSTQPRGREPQARGVSAGALDFWFI